MREERADVTLATFTRRLGGYSSVDDKGVENYGDYRSSAKICQKEVEIFTLFHRGNLLTSTMQR
jgi:hypothetical protein